MEYQFIIKAHPGATNPVALKCSRMLSDQIWGTLDSYEDVHMKHGRRLDATSFEYTWEMGECELPDELTEPTWIQSCVALGNGPNASRSIIAAVGRTVSQDEPEDVPF